MALATTIQYLYVPGAESIAVLKVTGDASYPAAGYPITPVMFGLNAFAQQKLIQASVLPIVIGQGLSTSQIVADIDKTTGNLRFYHPTGGATVPAGIAAVPTAAGAPPVGATAVTSTAAQPTITSALTAGEAVEVATGANVSTATVILLAFGH